MWTRRAMSVVGALILAGSALALAEAATVPAPGPACNYPPGSNTCLTIEYLGNDIWSVLVGIDVYMSHQEAQAIVNAGGELFVAVIMANDHDDPADDTSGLFEVPRTEIWVWDGGLSASFYIEVGSAALNEDRDHWLDEVCARVWLHDNLRGRTDIFHSGVLLSRWP
jgi:hypothetical protein